MSETEHSEERVMSDITLTLEEIRNKLDELDHKIDIIHQKVDQLKIFPQMNWNINGLRPVELKPMEIKDPIPNPYEIKC